MLTQNRRDGFCQIEKVEFGCLLLEESCLTLLDVITVFRLAIRKPGADSVNAVLSEFLDFILIRTEP